MNGSCFFGAEKGERNEKRRDFSLRLTLFLISLRQKMYLTHY
jgi:hypothetical protein